jgi:hypothetical protein
MEVELSFLISSIFKTDHVLLISVDELGVCYAGITSFLHLCPVVRPRAFLTSAPSGASTDGYSASSLAPHRRLGLQIRGLFPCLSSFYGVKS